MGREKFNGLMSLWLKKQIFKLWGPVRYVVFDSPDPNAKKFGLPNCKSSYQESIPQVESHFSTNLNHKSNGLNNPPETRALDPNYKQTFLPGDTAFCDDGKGGFTNAFERRYELLLRHLPAEHPFVFVVVRVKVEDKNRITLLLG